MNSKNRFILINLLAFEFVLLNLVLISYLFFKLPEFSFTDVPFLKKIAALTLIYNLSWFFIILYIREKEFYFSISKIYLKSLLISLFFFVGIVTTLVIVLKINYFARSTFIVPIFIFTYFNFLAHKYLLKYLAKKGSNHFSNTLLIGTAKNLSKLNGFTESMTQYGYNIVGYLESEEDKSKNLSSLKKVGVIDELSMVLKNHSIDEIFIAMTSMDYHKVKESIQIADSYGVRVKLIPEDPLLIAKNYKAVTMGDLAVFKLRQSMLDNFNMTILKRLFDFCFAVVVLFLLSPVYILIAIIIRLDSKGPTYYCPRRKGEAGKTFKCYKFRTMKINDNEFHGSKSTVVNDPRITRVGHFLRKTDLDELPQFFNVLKGDMSVIGPRPHRTSLQDYLRTSVNDYMVRSYIKPGITGWAQVNGWRGPTDTNEQKNQRINHDLWYIENWSFMLDLKIIFLTLFGSHRKKAF